MKKMKLAFVSTMMPSGHHSEYLTRSLNALSRMSLFVYADDDPRNLTIRGCGEIRNVWTKNYKYPFQIIRNAVRDRPNIVHFQFEINMYGGILGAVMFPLLLFMLKVVGVKTVVTTHSVLRRKQYDQDFIELFKRNSKIIRPIFLKLFFVYLNNSISLFADRIIVHTKMTKNILCEEYKISTDKVTVIPVGIPNKLEETGAKTNYFFYFGYIVRRKGLENVIEGFKRFIKSGHEEYSLVLAGGAIRGQEDAYLEIKKFVEDQNLEGRTVFRGFVEEEQLRDLYLNAIAVIIPAKVSMGASGPVWQAMSRGKCVLASNVGFLKEEIRDGVDGLLVNNNDWCQAFEYVVNNPERISRIESNVRLRVLSRSLSASAIAHLNLYNELLCRKPST